MPRDGRFVIGGAANHGGTVADMIDGLGVTRQAAGRLIDTIDGQPADIGAESREAAEGRR